MREIQGNIWDYNKENYIVITTNGSLTSKGACVMGRGVALQAKERYSKLPYELGEKIKSIGNFPYIFPDYKIITCPVKRQFYHKADIDFVVYSLQIISEAIKYPYEYWRSRNEIKNVNLPLQAIEKIYIPRPGCDNGKLDWETEVKPKISKILDDRFTIVSL